MCRVRLTFLIWLLVGLAGCSGHTSDTRPNSASQEKIEFTGSDALEVAKTYLDEHNIDYAGTRTEVEWHPDAWWVMFFQLIPKPGGDFVVLVSHHGEVLDVLPGY